MKNKGPKSKKKAPATNNFSSSDFVDDDKDLMKVSSVTNGASNVFIASLMIGVFELV